MEGKSGLISKPLTIEDYRVTVIRVKEIRAFHQEDKRNEIQKVSIRQAIWNSEVLERI